MYDIQPSDLARGRKLKIGAFAAPVILTVLPAAVTFLLMLLAATGPPAAAVILFVGAIATVIGFIIGLTISVVLSQKRSAWTREMRELIAADGIKAEEIDWFRNELKPSEKRALKAVEARDLMLADAYRETLASRLTATRIVKSSKRELLLAKRRQSSLKQLKSARAEEFQIEISKDIDKIGKINDEAKLMLAESESRLQMIEAASGRGGHLADAELALKKLTARAAELPLALESAKMTEEIRKELEQLPE
ncbi:MAG: hypothetical protein IPL32_15990 [Chloracidobacterium sp.]|nr:hypothetical protein [Chloracidobacterium sp.]